MTDIFKGLPEKLKNVEAYDVIEKHIFGIMKSDHTHRKVSAFMKCEKCKPKFEERKKYIDSLGFADYHQYLRWKQVMEIMKKINAKETNKKER